MQVTEVQDTFFVVYLLARDAETAAIPDDTRGML